MTEDDARELMTERFGSERIERVATFLDMVIAENDQQNLIAPSTVETIWVRHGLDSAQLMFHVEHSAGSWLDIGTGGGFPGMVIALLFDGKVTMVEPRKKRAAFLETCVDRLGIANADVVASKVEAVSGRYDIISARAVASVEKLLQAAAPCAKPETRWILPRGRMEPEQLTALRRQRDRVFHVEHSLTDPDSAILIVDRQKGRAS
ncbi:16S rRNA (guanine(527)-N(7))-methyltransferase RsmG [Arthrobacter sp. TPD3018]|uniref:16S rRNA (guanine(527)-N(7))-methyltransferase RsmG n=1 Tax=Bacteria TaxID=2 RepID=UPI000D516826|nr:MULTISPECIES: 16S rRNA (guanine(527)-N(7))-methyltransferase RsmG [Bacteria]PVE58951.1 16S rRNA (guanine(527)-N(7))-methyltransferase RsmG [Sphingomonas sp. TPD3009]PVE60472.1 16S rRNA (guanine(527)-N(7))-methyltransferase RsmG [Arthrobacter sp. TPD3018]PVE87151.1 16S rRNA (guanine(527)-N(7))-methyltransferase RsmG [Sphingomonas melonis]